MEQNFEYVGTTFIQYLPNLLGGVAVLVVGWLVALAAAALVKKLLGKTSVDDRVARWISPDPGERPPIEHLVSKVVFWVLMILVLVIVFQILGLTAASRPLHGFLGEVFAFLPRLAAAAGLLFLAWLVAKGLKFLVRTALERTGIDERLQREVEYAPAAEGEIAPVEPGLEPAPAAPAPKRISLAKTIGDTVYWLVFLLFLPAVLDTLGLDGLLAPVNGLLEEILAFLPNLLGAILILGIGWVVARIVQRVVTNLLAAAGTDRLGERSGLGKALGGRALSAVIGLVVYILILVPVLISALNVLGIDAVTDPASRMLDRFLGALPQIFAAALVLLFAWVIAKLVASLVESLLSATGFDGFVERLGFVGAGAGDAADGAAATRKRPSQLVGYLVLVAVMLFATIEALDLLQLEVLAALLTQLALFLSDVFLALLILAAGLYLANLAAKAVRSSGVQGADLLARLAYVAVVVLAAAMALRQAGVAEDIINLAFGLLLGALAVAAAIAFGIGGRDVAGRYLERWTERLEGGGSGSGDRRPGDGRVPGAE